MTRKELDKQLVELMRSGRFDGMVRTVRGQTGVSIDDAADAVYSAVVKLIERVQRAPVHNLTAWLTTVAVNAIKSAMRAASRAPRIGLPEPGMETDEFADPYRLEDDVVARDLLRFLKVIVNSWENKTMATVTELYLEAAFYGEPLSLVEARQKTEEIIGETISLGSIGTWKARGFHRLEQQLAPIGIQARATRADSTVTGEKV